MEFHIIQKAAKRPILYILDNKTSLKQVSDLTETEKKFAVRSFDAEQSLVTINKYNHFVFIYLLKPKTTDWQTTEALRKSGADVQALLNKHKLTEITLRNLSGIATAAYNFAEGIALANYQFLK